MDKGKAINRFLDRVDQFPQIVLVTYKEIGDLFGEEVTTALTEMEHSSKENRICSDCGGVCCSDIGCELYAAQFGGCPIYAYRPIACRLHFCHRFDALYRSLIIELRDVFVGCFRAVDFSDSLNLRSLDSPPLKEACPEFVAAVGSYVNAVREGKLSADQATQTIHREAENYRNYRADRKATV
jgi:hypothetical protein